MADVELIDFTIPVGGGHVLQLSAVPGPAGRDSLWLHLHTVYSQYGLLYQVPVRLGAGLLGVSRLPVRLGHDVQIFEKSLAVQKIFAKEVEIILTRRRALDEHNREPTRGSRVSTVFQETLWHCLLIQIRRIHIILPDPDPKYFPHTSSFTPPPSHLICLPSCLIPHPSSSRNLTRCP